MKYLLMVTRIDPILCLKNVSYLYRIARYLEVQFYLEEPGSDLYGGWSGIAVLLLACRRTFNA